MLDQFSRTELLFGADAMKKLASSRVAVFGIGGVGGYTVEALIRAGIGELDLIDNDTVSVTNINRQIIATHKTVGMLKVDAARERCLDINPNAKINTYSVFFTKDTENEFDFTAFDYVVDAIDTLTGKLCLVEAANRAGVPIISSMGAGNKLDPTAFKVADIYETSVCPLAKVMRKECKNRGIDRLKCVYSTEPALKPLEGQEAPHASRRSVPGSNSFVPSTVGLIIAGEVIKDLIE